MLLRWTDTLGGLDPERVRDAREEVDSWGWAHVSAALLADSLRKRDLIFRGGQRGIRPLNLVVNADARMLA